MSAFTAQNMFNVLIGKNLARTASVQITDPSLTATYIADGEIVILGEDGDVVTTPTLTTDPFIRFVQRSGDKLIYSPRIPGMGLVNATWADGTAGTEQVWSVGYTPGQTGASIDTSGTDPFRITIAYTFDEAMWSEQGNYEPYLYDEVASPSEEQIAEYMVRMINYKNRPQSMGIATGEGPLVRAEMYCDNAGATVLAIGGGTATGVNVTQDSDYVTFNGTVTTSMNVAAGDYIRIGAGAPATAAEPIYEVEAISINGADSYIRLTTPYQGASAAAVVFANVDALAAADVTAAACGFTISAQPLKWTKDFFKFLMVSFRVTSKGFGTTAIAETTSIVRPINAFEQISELESFGAGFEGALNRTMVPLDTPRTDADSGVAQYNSLTLEWYDDSNYSPIAGPARMRQALHMFFVNGAGQNATVETDLNAWLATLPSAPAAITIN